MQVLGLRVLRIEKFSHEKSTDKLIVSKEFREICVILSSDCRLIAPCRWPGGCVSCSLESVTLAWKQPVKWWCSGTCIVLGFRVYALKKCIECALFWMMMKCVESLLDTEQQTVGEPGLRVFSGSCRSMSKTMGLKIAGDLILGKEFREN